jgi:hypothetical protein
VEGQSTVLIRYAWRDDDDVDIHHSLFIPTLQQPSPDPVVDVVLPEKKEVETRYMVTRRRQWWRRVYSTE